MWNYKNRPCKETHDDLSDILRNIFTPCEVYCVGEVYAVFLEEEYTVWCAKTVIRNHEGLLQYIRDVPVPPGSAREWHRDGFVYAVDLKTDDPVSIVSIPLLGVEEHGAGQGSGEGVDGGPNDVHGKEDEDGV